MIARLKSWEGFLLLSLLVIIGVNASLSPEFLTLGNQINLFQLSIEKVIVALVMTFIIINGEIDLSVGSMMGLAACAFGWMVKEQGVAAPAAIAMALGIGVLGGALNGWFITRVGLPSLVVTLATLIGFRGLARVLVEDRGLTDFPEWFDALGQQGLIGPLPFALIAFAVLAYVCLFYAASRDIAVVPIALAVLAMTVLGLTSVNLSDALASVLVEGQAVWPYWAQTGMIAAIWLILTSLYLGRSKL